MIKYSYHDLEVSASSFVSVDNCYSAKVVVWTAIDLTYPARHYIVFCDVRIQTCVAFVRSKKETKKMLIIICR